MKLKLFKLSIHHTVNFLIVRNNVSSKKKGEKNERFWIDEGESKRSSSWIISQPEVNDLEQ